ncbi:uncharacterized protein LOC102809471 [Saccoglossus kowalevskii]|uniref:Uncharacterized protein LOC102809471 n=1 Tax=Saccoglossus kowalevskii TaxID=10224 RepID=A0ABM0MWJ2_SACKO|nr:PREDICTED: uncharacterized protein LOC102809471 [Saccoglossus kowalevskii]
MAEIVHYNSHLQEIELTTPRQGGLSTTTTNTDGTDMINSHNGEGERALKMCLPMFPMCFAATCLIFNIVIPGSGSILAAFGALFCCNKTSFGLRAAHFCFNFWCGIFQLAFAILIVGWIWSVLWGLMYVGFALDDDEKDEYGASRSRRNNVRPHPATVYPYPPMASPPPPPGSPPPSLRPGSPPPSYNEAMQFEPPTEEALVAVQNRYGHFTTVSIPPPSQTIYYSENGAQTSSQSTTDPPVDFHTPGQVPTETT